MPAMPTHTFRALLRTPFPVLAATLLLFSTEALAGDCDRSKAVCECGDTLTQSRNLSADLENCRDVGLRVASGVTLDCRNFAIRGRSDREGILLQEARGARVRNCEVTGFRFGVRVRAGSGNHISNNKVEKNRRGISIGEAAENTRVENNVITGSREMGVLINPATEGTEISGNTIKDNGRRNLDIREPASLLIDNNIIGGRTSYDLSLRDTHRAKVRNNEFSGGRIQIRGDSDHNEFEDNKILGRNSFDLRGELDREKNWKAPEYNHIRRGSILEARRCFRLAGASYNVIEDVTLGECAQRPVDLRTVKGHASVGNVFDTITEQGDSGGGTCGGNRACKCGDTARGSARLTEDLIDCDKGGLRLESGTTLDCDGHSILGRRSGDGIKVHKADNIRIRNCVIEDFKVGIRIQHANEVLITDSELNGHSTGIRVSGPASGIAIEGNTIQRSRDYAVRINDGVIDAELVQNTFSETGRSHVEIARTHEVKVDRNAFVEEAKYSMRLIDSNNAYVRGNTINEGAIELRGSSTQNRFIDNHLVEDGFRFDGIEERSGPWRFPDSNLVEGGAITEARRCFYIRGASNNTFRDVELGECESRPFELKTVDGHVPTNNVIE